MRVFAGPNGLGKTTINNAVRDYLIKKYLLILGFILMRRYCPEIASKQIELTSYAIKTTLV